MDKAVLEVDGVRSGYGAGDILQGVSLSVAPGEIVAVVGRNGVGKTTLMRTVMGLLPTRAGTIVYKGRRIEAEPPQARALTGLGYVPQGRMIFPFLSVAENLRMGERIGGGARHGWEHVFAIFPFLRERLEQRGGTLSGGQQQALAIARVLVGSPEILLLDEPSEGIQPSIIAEIGRVLRRLNSDTGQTILLVENNFSLIKATAQRAYVVDKGRTVATLSGEDVADRERMLRYLSV